jgi:serine O-acetyltransferase
MLRLEDEFYTEIRHDLESSYNNRLENDEQYEYINLSLFESFIQQIKEVMLPEYYTSSTNKSIPLEKKICYISNMLKQLVKYEHKKVAENTDMSMLFIKKLVQLRKLSLLDIKAAYERDPAANNYYVISVAYPGVYTIINHRISHELYLLGYPIIGRIISEITHSKTGIDIHPGAKIGESFFMDHGTGVVIGETTEIGNGVTVYQGVTLGAFSFQMDKLGNIVKGNKRHPTIEDNVTVYAGATILGGHTVIGSNSIVGGNVWLTKSIPAYSKVTTQPNTNIVR